MAMNLEQAVFASSDRGRMKGYQLIAQSAGLDRSLSQELCRWLPTRMPSDDPKDWTINYFPLSNDTVAVTRTVLGGPEYSCRGGTQVVTSILLMQNQQFESYACNPIAVARTAMALGRLRLPMRMTQDRLPTVEMPLQPLVDSSEGFETCDTAEWDGLLSKVGDLLSQSQRIALVGLDNPLRLLEMLLAKMSQPERRAFSFTTGLAPAISRPFQAHFLPAVDVARRRTLDSQSIVCVTAS